MGMSAAQAKLLSLTARRSDINFQLSSLMRGKLDLMTQASNAADALNAAKNNNNIFVMTTGDNQQTQLSFNNLAKEGLTIVDSRGRTIVPASYKSNPTGLASILPNNHPAISSYDGDFVVKNKLNKNYISLANTINIFDNDKDNIPQKKIKAASGEPTKVNKYSSARQTVVNNFQITQSDRSKAGNLADICNKYNLITVFARNGKVIDEDYLKNNTDEIQTLGNDDIGILSLDNTDKYNQNIENLFRTEIYGYDKEAEGISELNKKLGAEYAAYSERTFQDKVTYANSLDKVQAHAQYDKNDRNAFTYVSNAQQLITALLQGAKLNGDKLESDANIMLLNDIDLDDMLQDDNNGKKGLKGFIQDEISSLSLENASEEQKTAYKNAMNTFSNVTNGVYNSDNWADNKTNICKMFENLATVYEINTSNLSGLNIIEQINSVSDNDTADWSSEQKQFRKNAQDLYQLFNVIENDSHDITLSNGVKLTKAECSDWSKLSSQIAAVAVGAAAVGGTKSKKSGIDASVLANVYSKYFSGGSNDNFNENFTNFIQIDKFTGSIGGGGFAINNLKMSTTNGQFAGMFGELEDAVIHGVWMDNANVFAQRKDSNSKTRDAAILANTVKGDRNTTLVTAKGMQISHGSTQADLKDNYIDKGIICDFGDTYQNFGIIATDKRKLGSNIQVQHNGQKVTGGWSFKSTNFTKDYNSWKHDYGWRTSVFSGDSGFSFFLAEKEHKDIGESNSNSKYDDIRQNNDSNIYEKEQVTGNALAIILSHTDQANSKIKFFTKEEVDNYDPPGEDWKVGAKFDDGTEVNWDDWYIAPGSFNSETGEYTLTATHGEETAEYVALKENLEFYKSQGVIVEENENRDEGQFTYSARGYSVDLEYKDDLTKYNADNYLYKVENNDSSVIIYEREKVNEVDMSQLVFVDDIEALLDKNIKNGVWFVQGASVSDATKYERKTLDEIGISETTDENADAIAQAEYERKMREIELQEEKFDAQITELESTLKGVEQEIENQEKIVKQNVQSSFSTFAS